MKHLRSGLRAVLAIAFCAALLAPAALADNGGKPPGERPGNSGNAPGHNKDGDGATPAAPDPPAAPPTADAPPESAPPVSAAEASEADSAETPAPAVDARPGKPAKPEADGPAGKESAKPKPAPRPRPSATRAPGSTDDPAKESSAHRKVLVCHATGSATNPYVLISVSVNAWSGGHGHGGHAGDVFVDWSWPGDPRQKNDALCPERGPVTPPTTTTGTTTTSEPTTTASHPSSVSDDERIDVTATSTTGPAADGHDAGATMAPPVRKTAPPPARAVLARTGQLAGVAVRGTLPFTGVPLWAFALAGFGLVVLGFAVHRRAQPSPARK